MYFPISLFWMLHNHGLLSDCVHWIAAYKEEKCLFQSSDGEWAKKKKKTIANAPLGRIF